MVPFTGVSDARPNIHLDRVRSFIILIRVHRRRPACKPATRGSLGRLFSARGVFSTRENGGGVRDTPGKKATVTAEMTQVLA